MENKVSLKSELLKSISSSRSSLKETLERLQFLVSNFDGSVEHTRAIEFVETSLSLELASLKHLSKMYETEVEPPSLLKRLFMFLGFSSKTL